VFVQPDCADGSDENACSVTEDPNRADVCDPAECLLPECFCSADGTQAPGIDGGKLEVGGMEMFLDFVEWYCFTER
jgi:hypothetical protein